ncbi:MAG: low specificity L-threonine aldolase [Candidatus Izemoplasmatales bacterium]
MYYFKNDYSEITHPDIMKALSLHLNDQYEGYGLDRASKSAIQKIQSFLQHDPSEIYFLEGGTQTNKVAISSFLRPHEAVISVETGHIFVHETGAIENTGHKVVTVKGIDGKITIDEIQAVLDFHSDEHMVKPKLVYVSQSTEIGTIYHQEELLSISKFCRQHHLYLFVDGARLGSALTAKDNDITLSDLAKWTDAFYIGATKNGGLFGEALVINNPILQQDMRHLIKQQGAMLAKGFVLGIQFDTLFTNNLFFDLAKMANDRAQTIRDELDRRNTKWFVETTTNQLFPIFSEQELAVLESQFGFYRWAEVSPGQFAVRLVTSFATPQSAVDDFVKALQSL